MNSRSLINFLLFIILSAAAGWFYTIKNQPVKVARLSSLNIDEINQIRIPKDKGNDIVFKKTSTGDNKSLWKMLKPYQINAHQFRINTLLSLTQMPVDKFYDISDLTLADYSLDKPRAKITFNNTDILFGKSNPINSKRYIMVDSKMTLLFDQIYPLVSAQATTFIDLSLLSINSNITAIKLPEFSIYKNTDNLWQSTPENIPGAEQIQQLLEHWKTAQAFSVHRYLQRKQLGNIEIHIDNKPITFIISDDDPWLILARPDLDIEYHLDVSFKTKLLGQLKPEQDDA